MKIQIVIDYLDASKTTKTATIEVDEHTLTTDLPLAASQQLIEGLNRVLPEAVRDALLVRLADRANMFGRTYTDKITAVARDHHTRYSVQVHPYPWLAAGASNVLVHKNIFNELSVALVYNQRRDGRDLTDLNRVAGVPDFWKLPEGYMHPRPCAGGEQGISLVSADDMDEAEELMLKGLPIQRAYKAMHAIRTHSPSPHLPSQSYDMTTRACAVRESYEEIGYQADVAEVQLVTQREETRWVPSIVNVYLIEAKRKDRMALPPTLQVDGVEIKEAMWGKLSAFRIEAAPSKAEKIRISLDYYDENGDRHAVEVPIKYALMIGQAVRKFRDAEISKHAMAEGSPVFSSRDNVVARVKQILKTKSLNPGQLTLQDVLGLDPEHALLTLGTCNLPGENDAEKLDHLQALAHLGKAAAYYHKKVDILARALTNMPLDRILDARQLLTLTRDGLEIETNYLNRKVRLFPLARAATETSPMSHAIQDPPKYSIKYSPKPLEC